LQLLEAGVKRGKDWKTLNILPEKPEVAKSERTIAPSQLSRATAGKG